MEMPVFGTVDLSSLSLTSVAAIALEKVTRTLVSLCFSELSRISISVTQGYVLEFCELAQKVLHEFLGDFGVVFLLFGEIELDRAVFLLSVSPLVSFHPIFLLSNRPG